MGKVDFEKKIFQSHIWDRGPEWVGVFLNIHNDNHDPDYSEKEQFYLKTNSLGHTFIICNIFVTCCAFK